MLIKDVHVSVFILFLLAVPNSTRNVFFALEGKETLHASNYAQGAKLREKNVS